MVWFHVFAEDSGNCTADEIISRVVSQCLRHMPEEDLMKKHADIPHLSFLIIRLLHYDLRNQKIPILFMKRRVTTNLQGKSKIN